MKIGAHVSATGGVWNAPANAAAIGCEAFQMFSRPPQGGKPKPITREVQKKFCDACDLHHIHDFVIHAPYFINLASTNPRIRHGSITILREELERGTLLAANALMFHPGSARDVTEEEGVAMATKGIVEILDGYKGSCQLLIEISAGSGSVIGSHFKQIADILDGVGKKSKHPVGVCFDTQHAFASGYDLRTKKAIDVTLKELDDTIGLPRVMMSHANDSKIPLGGHKDRHETIGRGEIGEEAFKILVNHPKLKHWLFIAETPLEHQADDVKKLQGFRKKTK